DGNAEYILQRWYDHVVKIQGISGNHVSGESILGAVGDEWHILGVGDFNGDHTSDLLWQRDDGTLRIYDINNYQVWATPVIGQIGTEWTLITISDFNGDGTSDLLWRPDHGTVRIDDIHNNQITS